MRTTERETFDLVMGELDEDGDLLAVLVVEEGLSSEQAVMALEGERSTQLGAPGREFGVSECDGESFELVDSGGQSYRRYFLARVS
ncbi:MAG: hypothetical protein JSU66_15530 [Deltaproteobacteria bacterium]|nr:MAG: hypothetical protein JSU66_15530 [Deltaproteobacteria bacterium]